MKVLRDGTGCFCSGIGRKFPEKCTMFRDQIETENLIYGWGGFSVRKLQTLGPTLMTK
jgi:hypothetical protein